MLFQEAIRETGAGGEDGDGVLVQTLEYVPISGLRRWIAVPLFLTMALINEQTYCPSV